MKRFALILLLGGFSVGCSTIQAINMIPRDLSAQFPSEQNNNIRVDRVVAGKNIGSLQLESLAGDENRTFQTALEKSLAQNQLFSPNGRYLLKTTFEEIEIPFVFSSSTVTTRVRYILIDQSSGTPVMNELIEASSTATFSDSFHGGKRMNIARKGSARESIGQLLIKLSQLSSTSPPGYVPTESTTEEGEMMF